MRKLLIMLALALPLGGCLSLNPQGLSLSSTDVYAARQSFNAIEQTATNYLVTCHANPQNVVCRNKAAVEAALVPAVRAGREARNGLTACLKAQTAGTGCQSALDQLIAATGVVRQVVLQFKIGG